MRITDEPRWAAIQGSRTGRHAPAAVPLAGAVWRHLGATPLRSVVLAPFALVGVVAIVASILSGGDAQIMYAANGAELLFAVWLYGRLDRRSPDRPAGLVRLGLLLQHFCAAMLVVGTIIGGDFRYATMTGEYSYLLGAAKVASVNVAFSLALCLPALLQRTGRGPAPLISLDQIEAGVFRVFLGMAAVVTISRGALLFWPPDMAEVPPYVLRVIVMFAGPTVFFAGVALRTGGAFGKVLCALTTVTCGVTLLAGSRWDAIAPLGLLVAGYLLARPVGAARLLAVSAIACAALIPALIVGQALREDNLGRTGQVAMDRLAGLDERVARSDAMKSSLDTSIGRLISSSAHAVITRVPEEIPFEDHGIINIPQSLVETFLPRFNLSADSRVRTGRNWVLNDFGFLVNWDTSVELQLVPDAWYRAGWVGVVVIGLIAGLSLQWAEVLAYRFLRRGPEALLLLVVLVGALPTYFGTDIVSATRIIVFSSVAGFLLLLAARRLGRRSSARDGR
jgi:hypothetical protein